MLPALDFLAPVMALALLGGLAWVLYGQPHRPDNAAVAARYEAPAPKGAAIMKPLHVAEGQWSRPALPGTAISPHRSLAANRR